MSDYVYSVLSQFVSRNLISELNAAQRAELPTVWSTAADGSVHAQDKTLVASGVASWNQAAIELGSPAYVSDRFIGLSDLHSIIDRMEEGERRTKMMYSLARCWKDKDADGWTIISEAMGLS